MHYINLHFTYLLASSPSWPNHTRYDYD